MIHKHIILAAALVLTPLAAMADEAKDDGSTVVTLTAEARRSVAQDRLQATLSFEKTAKTPEDVQREINATMQAARAIYSKVSGVKVTTGGYNVWKQYTPEPAPKANGTPAWTPEQREKNAYWQGNQQLMVDGADRDDVLKLVTALQQKGFAVQGMNFYLSREAADALRDDLTAEALGTIKSRAAKIAQTLGMKSIRYARIDTQGAMPSPMPYTMMRAGKAMDMAMAAPMPEAVAQGGESDVSVNVSAEIRLK